MLRIAENSEKTQFFRTFSTCKNKNFRKAMIRDVLVHSNVLFQLEMDFLQKNLVKMVFNTEKLMIKKVKYVVFVIHKLDLVAVLPNA